MKKTVLLAILLIHSFYCFSQKENYVDSLYNTISNKSKRDQINIINSISFDNALENIKKYEALTDRAILFSKEIRDSLLLANSYASKSLVLHFSSKTDQATQLSLKAIKIYEGLNVPQKIGELYADLAWRIKYLDLDKALFYMRKSLKILEFQERDTKIDAVYDNYGVLLGYVKKWDSSLYYHKKSLKIKKSKNDSIGIPFGYDHLANVYLNNKKYNTALKYLDSSFIIRQKRNDIYGITDSYLYYGDLYFAKRDYTKAINNFKKGFVLSSENNYYPLKKYASELLFKSFDSVRNYEEALKYNLIYNNLRDSVLNVNTNNRVSELEIEYQTEKKEKEILLQRADIAEKELHLNQKNTQLIGLGVLAIVISLLGYLLYNQQKLKNHQFKKESELKTALVKIETHNKLQEQRIRISRDLHDNIGAQLTFIISSIDNLKYGYKITNDKLTNKLGSISEFTKETIYELRDTIWAMNKSEISLEDLQIRISNFIDKADFASTETKFDFNIDSELLKETKFTSLQGMNMYRIIQEAINNSFKYAEAKNVKVQFEKNVNLCEVSIKDDGKGFNVDEVVLGNGLNNMKKRAQEIGSNIEIISVLNKGTKIVFTV